MSRALGFEEWGESFQLDDRERDQMARYAESLLTDDKFKAILSEMEYNVLHGMRTVQVKETERLQELKVQLHAVKALRQMLRTLAADRVLEKERLSD